MDEGTPPYLADELFFGLVTAPRFAGASLADLSGIRAGKSLFATNLIERVERAWGKPLTALTCHEVTTLLIQKMALEWLVRPILQFASRFPTADTGYYPGGILTNVLRAAEEFHRLAQPEFTEWLNQDFEPFFEVLEWNRSTVRKVKEDLQVARQLQSG